MHGNAYQTPNMRTSVICEDIAHYQIAGTQVEPVEEEVKQ
jgi:hypothetical protein